MKEQNIRETSAVIRGNYGKRAFFDIRVEKGFEDNICDDLVIREIFDQNVYQVDSCKGVVVDIGANIGAFSIYAALLGAEKVYAFEPEKENFEILKKHIKKNNLEDIIIPINSGIWFKDTKKDVYAGQGATIIKELVNEKKGKKTEKKQTTKLDMISWDSALDIIGTKNINLLKMDCEWSEYPIFNNIDIQKFSGVQYLTMEFHSASKEDFGGMLSNLTELFNIHIIGSYKRGGQIYAKRY